MDNFANEASKDVEEASVFEGIFSKFLFECRRRKVSQEFEVLAGDDLEASFGEGHGVVGSEHIARGFVIGLDESEAFFLVEVVLVTGLAPIGDVYFGNGIGQRRIG